MRKQNVIAVGRIVVDQFPVAVQLQAIGVAQRDPASGMAIEPLFERTRDRTEIIRQRRSRDVQRPENKAAERFDPRNLREVESGVADAIGVSLRPRDAAELSGVAESPAVVRALERLRGTGVAAAHGRAAMRAAVVERPYAPLRIAHQDQRAKPQPGAREIVVAGNLALVAEIHPDGAEDPGHLRAEDRVLGVDPAMHAILPDQVSEIARADRRSVHATSPAIKRSRNTRSAPMGSRRRHRPRYPRTSAGNDPVRRV